MVILLLGPFTMVHFQCNLQKAPFWFLLTVSRKNPWLVLAEYLLYARLCVKCMACTNSFNPHDDLGVGSEILMMGCETLGYMSTPPYLSDISAHLLTQLQPHQPPSVPPTCASSSCLRTIAQAVPSTSYDFPPHTHTRSAATPF